MEDLFTSYDEAAHRCESLGRTLVRLVNLGKIKHYEVRLVNLDKIKPYEVVVIQCDDSNPLDGKGV